MLRTGTGRVKQPVSLGLSVRQKIMASIVLSNPTQERLERVFPKEMQSEARDILLEATRAYADYFGETDSFERFHIAALKVSRGDLKELRIAADLMNLDYRDPLVSARFANDKSNSPHHCHASARICHYWLLVARDFLVGEGLCSSSILDAALFVCDGPHYGHAGSDPMDYYRHNSKKKAESNLGA